MQKDTIQLGKKLIDELELGHDMTSHWMASYISELIKKAENAVGQDKDKVENQCYESILGLWEKRYAMQNGSRPFENYETVIDAISALNPTSKDSFYFGRAFGHRDDYKIPLMSEVWLLKAEDTDKAARAAINFCIEQAVLHAKDEKTISWLQTEFKLPDTDIPRVVFKFLLENEDEEHEDEIEAVISLTKEKLETFAKLQHLLNQITTELDESLNELIAQQTRQQN